VGPVGLLRDITTVVTEDKVNMVGVRTIENGDGSVTIQATLETTGIEQLSRLLSRLEIIRGVRAVDRVQEKKRKGGQAEPIPIRRAANQS
jgi:(p)ppGpp synthase/HD superfamily hydrolase